MRRPPNRAAPQLSALVAMVLTLAAAAVGCQDGKRSPEVAHSPPRASPAREAVEAAVADLQASDASFTIDVSVTGWNNWHTNGTGQVAAKPRSAIEVDFPGMPVVPHWLYDGGNLKMILLDQTLYVHVGTLSLESARSVEAEGAEWQRMNLAHPTASTLGLITVVEQATQYAPLRQLEMLLSSEDLTSTATETMDGMESTRYEGTVRLPQAVRLPRFDNAAVRWINEFFRTAQSEQAIYVLWLDTDHRMQKLSVAMRSDLGTLDMTMEIHQLGASTPIVAPPDSAVQ